MPQLTASLRPSFMSASPRSREPSLAFRLAGFQMCLPAGANNLRGVVGEKHGRTLFFFPGGGGTYL